MVDNTATLDDAGIIGLFGNMISLAKSQAERASGRCSGHAVKGHIMVGANSLRLGL